MKSIIHILLIVLMCPAISFAKKVEILLPHEQLVEAAEAGIPMAMFQLGKDYIVDRDDDTTPEDSVNGYEWFRKAYEAGIDSAAVFLLDLANREQDDAMLFKYSSGYYKAHCLLYGIGTEANPQAALDMYRKDPTITWVQRARIRTDWYKARVIDYANFSNFHFDDWLTADMLVRRGYSSVTDKGLEDRLLAAATAGDADAMVDLSIYYGFSTTKGQDWLVKAYETGNPRAKMIQLYAATTVENIKVSDKKYPHKIVKECFEATKKLAKGGDVMACILILNAHIGNEAPNHYWFDSFGINGKNQDNLHNTRQECREIMAGLGFPYYQYLCYTERYEKVKEKHIKWLLKSAENGYGPAAYELGQRYYDGKWAQSAGPAYAVNKSKALEWYTKAAELGHIPAYYDVGYMYETGEGTAPDRTKALQYYLKAATHPLINMGRFTRNTLRAAFRVAYAYETGNGLEQSDKMAYIYYYLATMTDNAGILGSYIIQCPPAALYKMGEFYDYGKGVREDPGKALGWYERAAKHPEFNLLPEPIKQQVSVRREELSKITSPYGTGRSFRYIDDGK